MADKIFIPIKETVIKPHVQYVEKGATFHTRDCSVTTDIVVSKTKRNGKLWMLCGGKNTHTQDTKLFRFRAMFTAMSKNIYILGLIMGFS